MIRPPTARPQLGDVPDPLDDVPVGVSAFLAIDDERVEVLCETRLARFETVIAFRLADLVTASIEVVPTFRRPHVTLAHTDLDALANGLRSCEHRTLTNPHFDRGST